MVPRSAEAQTRPTPPSQFTAEIVSLADNAAAWNTRLSWQDQSNNEEGFLILVENPDGSFRILGGVGPNVTEVNVSSNVSVGGSVTYAIISYVLNPLNPNEALFDQIVVAPPLRGPDLLSPHSGGGTAGLPLNEQFIYPSRPEAVTEIALVDPPNWLSMNPTNGQLSGTPPSAGNFLITVAVAYTDGWVQQSIHTLRIRPAVGGPAVIQALPAITKKPEQEQRLILRHHFNDPDAESAVRVQTTLGAIDLILFSQSNPATTANFLSYVNAGDYNDVLFHRSVNGFVLQGGGFKTNGTTNAWQSTTNRGTIINEPGISNTRGTVAMAKIGGFPNSASNQFFINTNNNAANLNTQNGGFAVFGRVAGNGMQVVDAIQALPRATYSLTIDNNATPTSFTDVPVNSTTAPSTMDPQLLVKMQSVTTIPTLQFQVTGNTQPLVASASIVEGELIIQSLTPGMTTISVTATDLDANATTEQFTVTVQDDFASWSKRENLPALQSGLLQDPDNDSLNNLLEYAFLDLPQQSRPNHFPKIGRHAMTPSGESITLEFPVRKFSADLRYIVEANPQLSGTWTEIWNSSQGFAHSQVSQVIDKTDHSLVTIRDSMRIGGAPSRFLRLRVEKQP